LQLRRRRRKAAPNGRRRIRKLRLLALLSILFALAAASFTFGLVIAIAAEIETLDPTNRRGDVDSVIYAAAQPGSTEKRVLAILRGDESRVLVPSEDIAPIMKQAIVAIEDKRFYEHNGVDARGITRALWEDIRRKGVVEGGSTITQQYVKNAYARNERTIARKVREAALAWQLTQRWSKDRVLTAYLNTIYFGNGAYGIQRAAQTYFKKTAKELTLAESALLAGIPADPSLYDPVQHPTAAKKRRDYILGLLHDQGRITVTQRKLARHTPLPLPEDVRLPGTQGPAPYFVNYVKDQLVAKFGAERVFGGGLAVTTTIDLDLQEKASEAIRSVLTNPDGPAAAMVAIDPRDGSVRAMVGGTNFHKSQFNLATQAERQPGSSFKPIVLATALREGLAPQTRFDSKPVDIDAGDRIWHVTNYEGSYLGSVDLDRAMVSSDNSVYAQLTKFVGPAAIVKTAHDLGIHSELPAYFSIGLGAVAVNPLDMTRAYATIANNGARVDGSLMGDRARVVDEVHFRKSGKTKRNEPVAAPDPALTPDEAHTITRILEEVVAKGTGRRAQLADRSEAGKTGTTDNYGDAWFVGYTPELVVAVWVGYPNELKPMLTEYNGTPVAGGTLPALIWKQFMTAALTEPETTPLDVGTPLSYEEHRVVWRDGSWKLDNGLCPGTRLVAYAAGGAPEETATCYSNEVSVPLVIGRPLTTARRELAAVPLGATVILIPAKPGKRPGQVMNQEPRSGFASAGSAIQLYVSHPEHGLLPNLVGSGLADARAQLTRLGLRVEVVREEGQKGTILQQSLPPGVAVAPGLKLKLLVGRGSPNG
jgi:penicillin-binding protein 1A